MMAVIWICRKSLGGWGWGCGGGKKVRTGFTEKLKGIPPEVKPLGMLER